jgi:sugar lactone lactonase YvrE
VVILLLLLLRLQGLLRLNVSSGQLEQLASRVTDDGSPIAYANGVDIASNGSIYFTASTDIFPARARDGSYDTGFAWAMSNFRSLPR